MPYSKNTTRPQNFYFEPSVCENGALINFSGVPMHPHETYFVVFDWYSTIPALPIIEFRPQSYFITPTEQSNNHVITTFFKSITNYNYDNSTSNVIGARVYDSAGRFIYENIGVIRCGDTCTEEGKPRFEYVSDRYPTPTPSITPTRTPTPTPTNSPEPSPTPTATPTPTPSVTDCSVLGYDNFNTNGTTGSINWGLLRVVSQYIK
jgi:hypothetical protein